MIKVINPSRLTRQPFFHKLINYLDRHDDVTLREIKHEFANFSNIDRSMEEYIKAGYVLRENKRYRQSVPLLENVTICLWIRKSLCEMTVLFIKNC